MRLSEARPFVLSCRRLLAGVPIALLLICALAFLVARADPARATTTPIAAANYHYDRAAADVRSTLASTRQSVPLGAPSPKRRVRLFRSAPVPIPVAAEDVGGGVLRHYTTADAAKAISESGRIEPGAISGKIWLTPDEYASGAEARSALALNKTPEGCFEIPLCRISGLSTPSRVAPMYGEAGGGIEVTTTQAIDVSGLVFREFGPK